MSIKPYAFWYSTLFVAMFSAMLIFKALEGEIKISDLAFSLVFAAVTPGLWIWLMRKLGYPVGERVSCPRCGTLMPMFRKPESLKQATWGGYTCPNCGARMDGRGREPPAEATR